MKLNHIIYTCAALGALTLSSCSDHLDTMPDNRVELKTTEQLRLLMNSAYPASNYGWICELSSDNMEDNNAPDKDGLRYNLNAYSIADEEMFAWGPCLSSTDTDSPSGVWEQNYASVAAANACLEVLEKMELEQDGKLDETQLALRGEALVLRAYCHFILANVFCEAYRGPELSKSILGVPYATKPETTVKPHYERGNLADTYDKIQADLEAGLPLINNGLYEVPKYHFNTAAANAFATRFYLTKREYAKALEHANAAFGGADVDVSAFLSPVWANLGNFYYISDFGKYAQNIDKQSNLMLLATYSQAWRHYVGSLRFAVIRDALDGTIHSPGVSWKGATWSLTNGKGGKFYMHPCFNGSCGSNGNSEYGSYCAANISEQFEYTDKIAGIGYTHVTRAEFTGDMLLLDRAEAKIFLGDLAGAFADLQAWDTHRRNNTYANTSKFQYDDFTPASLVEFYTGSIAAPMLREIHIDEICPSDYALTPDKEPYLQCAIHFRRLESLHMGTRWFDIKRFGIEVNRKIGRDGQDFLGRLDPRRALQLPQEVIAAGVQPNKRDDKNDMTVKDFPKIVPVSTPGSSIIK